jgi:hydroxymethylbilane synthase
MPEMIPVRQAHEQHCRRERRLEDNRAATPKREDVRDVLIYQAADVVARGGMGQAELSDFPSGATIGTSRTRRKMQLLAARPNLTIVAIRGNVSTRLQKVAGKGHQLWALRWQSN